ncbi:helix-turn-helix domain-containing protein [Paenibacillus filicis]|uniref:Helix-turn-helix domain-containing protein n=1 Tax=Paenibacillus gyeongsangnamensis TaxID=3388067 RepID=A0ABT4Q2K6_9BACL|nr:helix-turn-helix domain-containing protein [Paenibacillus filicis]MCZ8511066.1 helix-turn-helix domain-containing protein [Paenibacillus filicis]
MNKTWYKRLLLSYFPILFITVSVIIFIAVSMLSEFSIQETEKANRVFSKYVTDSMETSLKGIERVMLEEAGNSTAIYNFFEMKDTADPGTVYYETSKEMHKMMDDNPLIHSVYLYRAKDRVVLTTNAVEKLDSFQDKDFIAQALEKPQNAGWSPVREYSNLSLQPKDKVISLSKKALIPFGNQGIIVVNVRVDLLLRIVDEMINPDITFMDITDARGLKVYPVTQADPAVSGKTGSSKGTVITSLDSKVIGWHFMSGIKGGRTFSWVSAISRIWIGIGLATVLFSIVYTVYVTRRNYKPIEGIMAQINSYQSRSPLKGGDEFSFIGKVLDNLMDQTIRYEKQFQEDLIVRRKQFFHEVTEGPAAIPQQEWAASMGRFKLPSHYLKLMAGIAEIDAFAAFQQNYSATDRQLLKFALTNVVHEFSDPERLTVWAEWISDRRLAILLLIHKEEQSEPEAVAELLDRFRTWVAVNLKITLTLGLGRAVSRHEAVRESYQEALTVLDYKMSAGSNKVIRYGELDGEAGDTHKYYQRMDAMNQEFRIADAAWQVQLEQFAQELETDVLKDDDIRQLLRYFTRLLQRTMEGLSPEILAYWNDETVPALSGAIEASETLEELLPVLVSSLTRLHGHYIALRESKNHHQLMSEIRRYIEENYANPDLSLNLISNEFNVNAKYSSHLFKEEYGLKFVDFLMNLRMEHAKKLLLETELPLQDISEKVGYTHSISFGRTFKKVVGVTPGDYRKYMRTS